jgi:ABC-type lipoprotein release transport system permease subunit
VALPAYRGGSTLLKVSEIIAPESELVSNDLFLISETAYRETYGIPDGQYTDLVLSVRNPLEVRNIAEKISTELGDARPILRDEILRTYDSVFSWRQGIVFVVLSGAVLAFVIFAWDKAAGLSAEEKREIGILKAVGWETSDVLRMKFWEGALISLAAFLIGYVAAYAHVFFGSAMLFEPVLKGWATLYPDFRPTPFVDLLQVGTLFFFTVFPYTVATIVPIWRAAITDPDMVMR